MKTLNFEQMEAVNGGGWLKFLACTAQVTGGLGTLGGIAAALAFGTNPVGLVILIVGGVSVVAGVASDPTACD